MGCPISPSNVSKLCAFCTHIYFQRNSLSAQRNYLLRSCVCCFASWMHLIPVGQRGWLEAEGGLAALLACLAAIFIGWIPRFLLGFSETHSRLLLLLPILSPPLVPGEQATLFSARFNLLLLFLPAAVRRFAPLSWPGFVRSRGSWPASS